jgi:hypothetical protein
MGLISVVGFAHQYFTVQLKTNIKLQKMSFFAGKFKEGRGEFSPMSHPHWQWLHRFSPTILQFSHKKRHTVNKMQEKL